MNNQKEPQLTKMNVLEIVGAAVILTTLIAFSPNILL